MEINVEFNTFITIKDDNNEENEIEVLVNATGYVVIDRESDYENSLEVTKILIDSILSVYDNQLIELNSLTKLEKRSLMDKAHDYLLTECNSLNDFYEDVYDYE